ncbi:DUF411 domain-containing protein [Vibrio sp. F74]|uniref:DUF411 domain-containing protein n=1 Tax=Vibrio sp. F74 TaxID=700020 RepID=UPI0035F5D653
MKRLIHTLLLSTMTLSFSVLANPIIELYKSPTCGCCKEWAAIMEKNGYEVNVHHSKDWRSIKKEFGMPGQLTSCHTALIDGYMVEGHVPESDISRLLNERPESISGIAAPGMPQHSPGMAKSGQPYKGFNVIAFNNNGQISLYNKY